MNWVKRCNYFLCVFAVIRIPEKRVTGDFPVVGVLTDHLLYKQLEEAIRAVIAAIKRGATRLRVPFEFDARYVADAYAAEYLGPLDKETGSWCVEALLQHQEDDLRIMEYEGARIAFCMSGCAVDCRPVKIEAGEPLRRAVERRYLVLGENRLICFDVNALPDAVGGLGYHDAGGNFVVSSVELEERVEEMAAVARWHCIRDFLKVKGYSLLIAGPKPKLTHDPVQSMFGQRDWCCQSGSSARFVIERTLWNGGRGLDARHAAAPMCWEAEPEYAVDMAGCQAATQIRGRRRISWAPVAAARPRPLTATVLPNRAEEPEWWFAGRGRGRRCQTTRPARMPHTTHRKAGKPSKRVKEEAEAASTSSPLAADSQPDLGDDADWEPSQV